MGLKYLSKDVTLNLNKSKCIGCGLCHTVCPHRVFQMKKNKATIVSKEQCIECGACAANCPVDAIQLTAGVGCAIAIMADKSRWLDFKWLK